MAAYITVGATTTHGGKVITGSPHTTHNGVQVSRKGDKVVCRKCKKLTTILTGDASFIVDGAPIAREGDVTSCGAKLIAVQQSFCESDFEVMGVEQPEFKQPAPLQFNKSDPEALFAAIREKANKFKKQLLFEDEQGNPYSNTPYVAFFPRTQALTEGMTDDQGYTEEFATDEAEDIIVHLVTELTENFVALK